MLVLLTELALRDLDAIEVHVARDDPAAAARTVLTVLDAVEALRVHPNIGRPGRVAGSRELVISPLPYIAIYRVQQNVLWVLRVLHGARRWPPSDADD